MLRLAGIVAHRAWKFASSLVFSIWRLTGIRPRYLSSKGQDRWICTEVFPGLRGGFFVEVGAGNGFIGSDTYVLEQEYGWTGICIEPNPFLYCELTKVVKRHCVCVQVCIDRAQASVLFVLSGDTSGIVADDTDNSTFMRGEHLRRSQTAGMVRQMPTTTMLDVLLTNGAPPVIHYLSVDVEGAEERLLESFPFDRYRVLAMTIERPTPLIHEKLIHAGFVLTKYRWHDGFYVQRDIWSGSEAKPNFQRKAF